VVESESTHAVVQLLCDFGPGSSWRVACYALTAIVVSHMLPKYGLHASLLSWSLLALQARAPLSQLSQLSQRHAAFEAC
jgi:hypothetical protein